MKRILEAWSLYRSGRITETELEDLFTLVRCIETADNQLKEL